MQLGRRVGVTAQSHKAIHNLLEEVERAARDEGFTFRGLKKGDAYDERVRHHLRRTRRTSPSPRTTCCSSPAPRGSSRARTWRASSTRSSSTRPARSRSPTRSRSATCGAERRPARRPAAARAGLAGDPSRRARRPRCSSTCSAAPTPSRRTAASSSRAPGGCTPTSAASSRRPRTRAGSTPSPECARQRIDSPGLVGHRAPLAAGRARGQPRLVARGGRPRSPPSSSS